MLTQTSNRNAVLRRHWSGPTLSHEARTCGAGLSLALFFCLVRRWSSSHFFPSPQPLQSHLSVRSLVSRMTGPGMRAARSSGAYLRFLERTVAFLFTHDRYFSLPRWKREFGCRRSRVRVKRPPARVTVRTYARANDDFPDVEGRSGLRNESGRPE